MLEHAYRRRSATDADGGLLRSHERPRTGRAHRDRDALTPATWSGAFGGSGLPLRRLVGECLVGAVVVLAGTDHEAERHGDRYVIHRGVSKAVRSERGLQLSHV